MFLIAGVDNYIMIFVIDFIGPGRVGLILISIGITFPILLPLKATFF